ncbi:protein phosphatase 2C domain-containing protein [Alkalihalophilus pseudofirmus]|uniref:Protein phosphatase 2C domain-containing protein n=1 Tax=Alkalihalophilus pseudofirmus TaxID=79885 RepID=A0AAJ2NLS9_ALKPS|nr:protein phosphatase 2C domain-containing protein [Alkalihalophilus pseudofirmus]MDV2884853.1 protein phosphatase 2C domain-containing protein [Alkalihalophilus pseudofirmus]
MSNDRNEFSWVGSQEHFIDDPDILMLNHMVVGRYGGHSKAGQSKNEDGCLVWFDEKDDWEFTIILDAHHTAESAELIVTEFNQRRSQITKLLSLNATHQSFKRLEENILILFQSSDFRSACSKVQGETSCLIVARKDKYVGWFSVGDCVLYLFHKELAALDQYQLNQRHFYQWIGKVNTFEGDVPCYSVGIHELRKGENRILVTTDGLIECPNEPYSNPLKLYNSFKNSNDDQSVVRSIFDELRDHNVKDNTTIISWNINSVKEAAMPSKSHNQSP